MKLLDPLRVWWQKQTGEEETPFDGDAPAWAISLAVHLVLLMLLTAWTLAWHEDRTMLVVTTTQQDEEELQQLPEKFYFSEDKQPEIGANSMAGEEAALAEAPVESEFSEVPTPEFEAEVGNVVVESTAVIAAAPNVNANAMVRGTATGVGATGAVGAVDRITHEILLSLEQRKTLVVWIFDKSGSLQRQRAAIRERFDRIYHELGVIEAAGNEAFAKHEDTPLLTAVMAFGKEISLMTPKPTDNLEEIKSAVDAIENDPSGLERTFSAVFDAANRYRPFRIQEPHRNVMLVVVSDEAGDDQEGLDTTVQFCRKYQMPVYVIGVPAPFGRQDVEIKYVDPDPEFDQRAQWIPVHQGPETLFPERIKLHFSGEERDEPMDSGFGPYALTRLCYETGGIYFAVHPNRNRGEREINRRETAELSAHLAHFFDPTIMRRYRPDYVSAQEYEKLLNENTARMALVKAAQLSWADAMGSPRLIFPKQNEAELANLLSEAQQEAAKLEPKLDRIYQTLTLGEPDRPKLTQDRWKAGFDLAMGRVLAVMVRSKSYNAMLAQAKQGMKFKDEQNDTWELTPSDKISVGSVLEKQGKLAREYLERVVKEHEGTPWAMLAERELKEPLGWEWKESYTGVNAPRQGAGTGNAANPANDKRKKMAKPKPVRRPNL